MLYASELIGMPKVGYGGVHLGYCYFLCLPRTALLSLRGYTYI